MPPEQQRKLQPGVDDALISYIQDHKNYYATPFERRDIQRGYITADTRYSEPFYRKAKKLPTKPSTAVLTSRRKLAIKLDQSAD